MSYQIRRIDPYWWTHPAVPVLVAAGGAVLVYGTASGRDAVAWTGLGLAAVGVVLGTKPAVSGVLGVLGVLGGVLQFAVLPNREVYGMPLQWKAGTGVLFGLMYMVLMDAAILAGAVLYNLFSALAGGVRLDIEDSEAD